MKNLHSLPKCRTCSKKSGCLVSTIRADLQSQGLFRFQVDKKETIFVQDMPVVGWYFLCHGLVKLELNTRSGKRLLIRFCGPGDLINEGLFLKHPTSAIAVEKPVISFVHEKIIFELFRTQPDLAVEVLRRISQAHYILIDRLAFCVYESVRARLCRELLRISEKFGVRSGQNSLRIELPLSLQDLAEAIGATPQTTSQELHALAKRGLVTVAWPTVLIQDVAALRQFE